MTLDDSSAALDAIKDAVNADISHVAACAALLGVILHHSVLRRYEVEQFMYKLIGGFALLTGGLMSAHVLNGHGVLQTVFRSGVTMASLLGGTLISMVVYRVFFHRLRKFPGPWAAKVSKFYGASLAAKTVQYHKDVARMHEQYGDFIRTGPRELAIVRSSAVPLIYGPQTKCRKATWYTQVDVDCTKNSINLTRDKDDYRRRRRAWDRGFSMKGKLFLNTYAPRVEAKVDDFIAQAAKQGTLDTTAWTSYLSFDIMGDVGLGKDFAGVASGQEHPAIKAIHDHMTVLSIGGHVPWLLNLASRIPGCTAGYAPFFNWCAAELKAKQKTWKSDKQPTDIVSWLIKAQDENDPTAPPSDAALHEDSRVIIVAGSETTATTLAAILYYLATHPRVHRKLQQQLDAALNSPDGGGVWSYEKVKAVTYVDDIINEALRLKPALLTGSYRVTPPGEGLQIDEVHIPGDTTVFVPTQLIQTDPRYWGPRAHEFVPERFSEDRAAMGTTDGAPFMPFTLGLHSCPGKNLALMSLRMSVSKIALNFDLSLAPGEDGKNFDEAALETFTTTLPPLQVQFSKRA
ncbi:hypothetical protein E8E14_014727 [Neopestalotiopsis sp. 37M]|nr:hypothetical protein E8E14_014727 [Neopestalotiopsis sp. 37M]